MDIASPLFDPRFLEQYRALMEPPPEARKQAGMDSLLALGLGLLANRGPHLAPAIGNAGFAAMGTYRDRMDSARQNRMGEIQGAMGLRKLQKDMEAEQRRKELVGQISDPTERLYFEADPEAYVKAKVEGMKPTEFQREAGSLGPDEKNRALRMRLGLDPKPVLPSFQDGAWVDPNKLSYTPVPEAQGFLLQRSANSAPQTTVNLPKMTDDTRKEFMGTPAFKNYETVQRVAMAARSAAKRNDKASDYDLITAVAKVVDPESVVRESEFTAWGSAQSPLERFQSLVSYVSGGGVLSPGGRQKLLNVVENRASATKKIYDATKKGYEKIAAARNLPPEELFFPEVEDENAVTPQNQKAFQDAARAELKRRTGAK
jgi:hypothetical protein